MVIKQTRVAAPRCLVDSPSSRRNFLAMHLLHVLAMPALLGWSQFGGEAQAAENMSREAAAHRYPNRPIRLIVAFPPGGGSDTIARIIGQKLSDAWREPVVIDNRPGAGGNLAAEIAARAAPDGYTLLQSTVGHTISANLYRKLPYDLQRDFVAVTELASTPFVLVVKPSLPVNSVTDLVARARAKPDLLNYASSGNGSPNHLAMELFKSAAGIEARHIPYKGSAQMVTDLLGGRVDMLFTTIPAVLPFVKAGTIRALGVGSLRRVPIAPDIPTINEAGVKGFEAGTWFGVLVPAGTPRSVVGALHRELVKVLHQPDVLKHLDKLGFDSIGSTPEEFTAYIRSQLSRWAGVVRKSRLRVE